MDVKNNPAGRLHDLLTSAQSQSPRETSRKAWASVFGVEENNTGALLNMLADLIDLVDESKRQIGRLSDVDHAIYLKPFGRIERLLSNVNLDAPWEQWKTQLDETTLYGLQFGADQLSRTSGFTHIKNADLAQLQKDVEALISQVMESGLPNNLVALVLRNLEAIQHALLAYRVRGIEGLEQEIERSVGSMILHKSEVSRASADVAHQKVWGSFFELMARLHKLVSFAKDSKELAAPAFDAVIKLLQ